MAEFSHFSEYSVYMPLMVLWSIAALIIGSAKPRPSNQKTSAMPVSGTAPGEY